MRRDIPRLAHTTFDLLIVGAGIYGAGAAWDAVLRGLGIDAVMPQARVPGPAMEAGR